MAVDFFTEMIDDVKKNPEMTEESIMNSKEALWKPRFELCDELERRKDEKAKQAPLKKNWNNVNPRKSLGQLWIP